MNPASLTAGVAPVIEPACPAPALSWISPMSDFFRVAAAAALLATAAPLSAQEHDRSAAGPVRSQTSGFMAGLSLSASSLGEWGDSGPTAGGGLATRLGYGFSRVLVVGSLDIEALSDDKNEREFGLGHGGISVRYSLGSTTSRLRPYVQAGALVMVAIEGEGEDEVTSSGSGLAAGIGTEYFVRRSLALDLGAMRTRGRFRRETRGGVMQSGLDIGYETTRFAIGLNWRP